MNSSNRCWYISFLSAILYFLKRAEVEEPENVLPVNSAFLTELWRLNGITTDVVLSPVRSLRAYINRFNLDQSFLTQQKTALFAFMHMMEIPSLRYLTTPRMTTMRYRSPCECHANGITYEVDNLYTPVFQIPWSNRMNLRTSIQQLFERHRVDMEAENVARCQGDANNAGCGQNIAYMEDFGFLETFTKGLIFCVNRQRYIHEKLTHTS